MPPKSDPVRAFDARLADVGAALTRELRVSKALREVGVALGSTLDLDELLELILQKITEALEADRATLYLLDEANDELVSRIAQGQDVRSIRLKIGHGIAGYVARTGKPLHVRDPYRDARFSAEWDMISGYRTRSILAAPMRNHLGRTIGVVQVLNKTNGEFSDDDADILAALATQAAVSIDNSRLFMSVTQKNIQLLDTERAARASCARSQAALRPRAGHGPCDVSRRALHRRAGRRGACGRARHAWVQCALRDPEDRSGALYAIDDRAKKMKRLPYPEDAGLSVGRFETTKHSSRATPKAIRAATNRRPRREDEAPPVSGGCRAHRLVDSKQRSTRLEQRRERSAPRRRARRTDRRGPRQDHALSSCHSTASTRSPLGAIAIYNKRGSRPFSDEDRALLALIAANASTAIRLQLSRETREREERLTTIGRLLSSVIHDLKTPLTVINGYVQLMQTSKSAPDRKKYGGLVLKQFDHIAAMQREVLEFARGEKSVLVRKVYVQKFFEDVRGAARGRPR